MLTLYGIPNCDSCKKARKWLDEHSIEFKFHDLRADGLAKADIKRWSRAVTWEKLLNTRSTTWRSLDISVRNNVNESKAMELLLEHPTLIKRPVLEHSDSVMIGFAADQYREFAADF